MPTTDKIKLYIADRKVFLFLNDITHKIYALNELYLKVLLEEIEKYTNNKDHDRVYYRSLIKHLQENNKVFDKWHLRAEDIVKTFRKSLELDEMEKCEEFKELFKSNK
jgi:hypothetical protein